MGIKQRIKKLLAIGSSKGFTLIELSVLMVIVSAIAVNAITAKDSAIVNQSARKITANKIDNIKIILDKYYEIYGAYPCPADGRVRLSEANAGISQKDGVGTCRIGTSSTEGVHYSSGETEAGVSNDEIYMGVVPFKTLGISPKAAMDAWGRRLGYAISGVDTDVATTQTNASSIIILNRFASAIDARLQAAANVRSSNAAYVVLSYGKDGVGAFPYNGGIQIHPKVKTLTVSVSDINGAVDEMGNEVNLEETQRDSVYQRINHHMANTDSNATANKIARVFIKPDRHLGQYVSYDDMLVFGTKPEATFLKQLTASGAGAGLLPYSAKSNISGSIFMAGQITTIAPSSPDCFVSKLTTTGDLDWIRSIGAISSYDNCSNVTPTSDGGVVVSAQGGFIVKFDTDGSVVWAKDLRANISQTIVNSVIEDSQNNIMVAGYINAVPARPFLIKLSQNGNLVWRTDLPVDITQNAVYLTETSNAGAANASDAGYALVAGIINSGPIASVVFKLDLNGNLAWQQIVSNVIWPEGVTEDSAGNIIILGSRGFVGFALAKLNIDGSFNSGAYVVTPRSSQGYPEIDATADGGFVVLYPFINSKPNYTDIIKFNSTLAIEANASKRIQLTLGGASDTEQLSNLTYSNSGNLIVVGSVNSVGMIAKFNLSGIISSCPGISSASNLFTTAYTNSVTYDNSISNVVNIPNTVYAPTVIPPFVDYSTDEGGNLNVSFTEACPNWAM